MTSTPIDDPFTRTLEGGDDPRVRLDYAGVCALLARELSDDPARGYVVGKTRMRDLLVAELGIQATQAEGVLDRLEEWGALVYEGSDNRVDDRRDVWRIEPGALRRQV